MATDSNQHQEPFNVEAARLFANRYMPDSGKRRLHEACDEIERLEEQLEASQRAQHVQNLEWAISLAESDPLYAEVFRPYFQKIVDALNSNPASKSDD